MPNIRLGRRRRLRFFAHFLHELQTPIALVDGPLQQLARLPGLDPQARELVAVARQNCLRLLRIAGDFLALARPGGAVAGAVPEEIDLDEWLRGLCAAASHHPALGSAVIREDLAAPGACVRASPLALERIFLNLLSNAIRFSEGRGEIRIGTVVRDDRAGFFVEDRGIGIARRHHRAIFRRFRQVEVPGARHPGGFGLGLAIVRELARGQGARVELRSAPGEGARFTVWLARTGAKAPARWPARFGALAGREDDPFEILLHRPRPPGPAALAAPAPAGAQPPDRPRVVVVEDEPEMRWLLASGLAGQFRIEAAADAASGWEAVLRASPDVVLADWMLPDRDGLWLVSRIRSLPDPPRIVLVSAHLDEAERIDALGRGVDDFLGKPFSLAELRARLRNLALAARCERRLREANRELAALRAALIHEEKLKSIGLLAAGLLHEIQNPVNYMQSALALLRDCIPGGAPRLAECAATCEEGIARIGAIINDLRVFSVRPGTLAGGARQSFDLAEAARTALRLCHGHLQGIEIESRLAPCRVQASEGQVVQVFVNLVANAAAALRGAGPAARILVEVETDGALAHARVRDNGPGFDPGVLARPFEPFLTTRPPGEGMGLGLCISRTIVAAHGGLLRAANAPGGGALVEFSLPLPTPEKP